MSARQHFAKKGDHYNLSAPASFLMVAVYAYDPSESAAPGLREHVDVILARATRAGFGQADILVTMLSNGEQSARTMQLACDVTYSVGGDGAMIAMIRDFDPKKGSTR
ncbi:hypothetical protein F2P44_21620 [Massilia sp. CCM 8695]|uniref:Uncharacterized protein n=1 Tax=Massilia frigida TaxID=2609281 RepID=A0ABX0N8X1_9BURK|nr:hypothetical protein [Massilia frigida]NHZ81855.1 hypothetical protein [Massilia frigida]